MDEQELDRMLPGWRALSDAVGRELVAWREAHPRASLNQIPTACPIDPGQKTPRGDGLLPVSLAAERLGVSKSLIHVWIQQGVLASEQRTTQSDRGLRLKEDDMVRLDGRRDWSRFSTVRQVMRKRRWSREQVWRAVRDGAYVAYRQRSVQHWEWRLRRNSIALATYD